MVVTVPNPTNPWPVTANYVNGGFLWREDESLKQYINNIGVVTFDQTSGSGGRTVPAYFRMSEGELRKREYPFILIDRIGWTRDAEREMRGPFRILATDNYAPDGTTIDAPVATTRVARRVRANHLIPSGSTYTAQMLPIPVMVQYQVQAWTRFKKQMMWIENQMSTVVFPTRFGAIEMAASPEARDDNTVRRLELLEGPIPTDTPDPDNEGKRLFGRTWTVAIPSEILPSDLERTAGPLVDEVIIDPSDRPGYDSVTPDAEVD